MKKRVFIAVCLSEPLQKEILEWERGLRHLPVRWLVGKNLHITLVPLWYAEEKELEEIKSVLRGVGGEIKPFEFGFAKVAFGPVSRTPRLIWAEGAVPDELLRLKERLELALRKKGEKRPFLLHLTLARFRPEDFGGFAIKTLDEKVDWKEKADSFVLMESHLSPSGADYKVLSEACLVLR